MVHASEFLLAEGTFPATLTVGLRQSHVSPARSGARGATTGTKRWKRELWCFFFHAGASEAKYAYGGQVSSSLKRGAWNAEDEDFDVSAWASASGTTPTW